MDTEKRYELSKLINLSFPVILSQIGNISMGMVDTYVTGNFSSEALAGVAAGNSVFWPIAIALTGLFLGMDALVTKAFAKKDLKQGTSFLSQSLIICALASLAFTPIIFFSADIFFLTGASPDVVAEAQPYISSLALSLTPMLFFNCLQRYWQALELVAPITMIILLANIINYILNRIFVEGLWGVPSLGAEGVGYATLGCRSFQLVSIILLSWYFVKRKRRPFPMVKDWFRYHSEHMKLSLKISLPASAQIGLEVLAFNMVTVIATRLGVAPLASHQIILNIASFTFMFPMGIAIATSIRVGHLTGQANHKMVAFAGNSGIALGAMVMAICGLGLYLLPVFLTSQFSDDPDVIVGAISLVGLCALFQVADGVQVVAAGALRGIGNTKTSLFSNIIGFYVVGLPVAVLLCFYYDLGLLGLWMGLAVSLLLVAIYNLTVWWYMIRTGLGLEPSSVT